MEKNGSKFCCFCDWCRCFPNMGFSYFSPIKCKLFISRLQPTKAEIFSSPKLDSWLQNSHKGILYNKHGLIHSLKYSLLLNTKTPFIPHACNCLQHFNSSIGLFVSIVFIFGNVQQPLQLSWIIYSLRLCHAKNSISENNGCGGALGNRNHYFVYAPTCQMTFFFSSTNHLNDSDYINEFC